MSIVDIKMRSTFIDTSRDKNTFAKVLVNINNTQAGEIVTLTPTDAVYRFATTDAVNSIELVLTNGMAFDANGDGVLDFFVAIMLSEISIDGNVIVHSPGILSQRDQVRIYQRDILNVPEWDLALFKTNRPHMYDALFSANVSQEVMAIHNSYRIDSIELATQVV